jgi:four helix bundle protein
LIRQVFSPVKESLTVRRSGSTASNNVEGCARHSESESLHFLDMAYGSATEVEYQIGLSHRLGFLGAETAKVLNGLIRALRKANPPPASGLKPPA